MKKYTILEIAEELNTNKTQIRRIIKENNVVAINETTREHKYIAKLYNNSDLRFIRAKLNGTFSETESEQNETESEQSETESKYEDLATHILREELFEAKKQLERAYEEKKDLMKLLDQQQQLQLNTQKQLEQLKLEYKENDSEVKFQKKKNWKFWK